MPFLNSEDVYALTGETVEDTDIALAVAVLESYTGRVLSAWQLSDNDTLWMRRAVAYQTVWQKAQPDLFERLDVTNLSYDEINVTPRDADSLLIGPMALRSVANCSWSNVPTGRTRMGSVSTVSRRGRPVYDIYTKREGIVWLS